MKRAAEEEVQPEPEKKTKLDPQAVGTEVHVSSLPWDATENHIRDFFSFAGEVLRVKLLTWDEGDFAGKSKVCRHIGCHSPVNETAAAGPGFRQIQLSARSSSGSNQGSNRDDGTQDWSESCGSYEGCCWRQCTHRVCTI